jgi:hypothetical protein
MRYYEIIEAVSANLNKGRGGTSPVVYHGGPDFDAFALQHDRHIGFFFTSDRIVADDYAEAGNKNPVVYSAKLTYQNPLRVNARGKDNWELRFERQTLDVDDLCKIAKERGHDAVIVKNVDDTTGRFYRTSDVYVVWNASQIELVKKERLWGEDDDDSLEWEIYEGDALTEDSFLSEKIVHVDRLHGHIIALNPTHTEFRSQRFLSRDRPNSAHNGTPSAAGVLMQNGNVVIGNGSCLAHDDICDMAGLDIMDEKFRLQIYDGKVFVELWLNEDDVTHTDSLEEKIAQAEKQYEMPVEDIRKLVFDKTTRFTGGWPVEIMLWCDGAYPTNI